MRVGKPKIAAQLIPHTTHQFYVGWVISYRLVLSGVVFFSIWLGYNSGSILGSI